ncbi:MAG: Cas10/Cmr2 second palm domain-containing protein, partial [Ktedonobacteraceae bacterium]
GKAREQQRSLQKLQKFANDVDNAVFNAMGQAIAKHLPVQGDLFPFDILLIGGDDILIVVPAAKALQVAHTLAETFQEYTRQMARTLAETFQEDTHREYTLSVGVVLAPVKYPFRLQQELADEVLKAAKKAGSSHQMFQEEQNAQETETNKNGKADPSYVNFLVVTGSTSLTYKDIYRNLHRKHLPYGNKDEFYATMRPYTLDSLDKLLKYLKAGHDKHLGQTKLHQLREAILKLNRTTTILESLVSLRNWKKDEQQFIEDFLRAWDERPEQEKRSEMIFPWIHKSNENAIYRTPLLDFIELYDFVTTEGGINA